MMSTNLSAFLNLNDNLGRNGNENIKKGNKMAYYPTTGPLAEQTSFSDTTYQALSNKYSIEARKEDSKTL